MADISNNPFIHILNKYFDEPACKSVWKKWSNEALLNFCSELSIQDSKGRLSPAYIHRLRAAMCSNDHMLANLYREMQKPEYEPVPEQAQNKAVIKSSNPLPHVQEFLVMIEGQRYLVIYGEHINGGFCCIPNKNYGCEMADPGDIFYNAQKLMGRFDLDTAMHLAEAIKKAHDALYSQEDAGGSSHIVVSNKEILQRPWATTMTLSTRARNCLSRASRGYQDTSYNLETVEDIASLSSSDIYRIRNLGKVTIKEIRECLHSLGITGTAWDQL